MSAGGKGGQPKAGAAEHTRQLLDQWVESLAQVLESMTDQRPSAGWQPATAPTADGELLWWEQPFQLSPGMKVWVAAPRQTWEHLGTLTLKAAGLETVELSEARNTWFEILGQSLGGMARSMSSMLGQEVTCEAGAERPPQGAGEWSAVTLGFPEAALPPLLISLSPELVSTISALPPEQEGAAPGDALQPARPEAPETGPLRSRTVELLLDVDLPVSISF
jgi:hypothetical protein